ncbi:hypothetical protein HDN1F_09300 [gamma proteobacterium HdN1]|nr:hypothetical protein HDN1F_09300 [gamma proteobacterium HdN1]
MVSASIFKFMDVLQMHWLAALLFLCFNLFMGALFCAISGAVASGFLLMIQKYFVTQRHLDDSSECSDTLRFKPLWWASSLVFAGGLLLGGILRFLLGEPSIVTSLIGIPIFIALFSLVLYRKFPLQFGNDGWHWRTPLLAFAAMLISVFSITALLWLIRTGITLL